jgi:hypothetical protein
MGGRFLGTSKKPVSQGALIVAEPMFATANEAIKKSGQHRITGF